MEIWTYLRFAENLEFPGHAEAVLPQSLDEFVLDDKRCGHDLNFTHIIFANFE